MKQVLVCGHLFDSKKKSFTAKRCVYVENGKIVRVAAGKPAAGWQKVDLSSKYVLPGLIDAHVHVNLSGGPNDMALFGRLSIGDFTIISLINAQRDLMAGFTTIRDEGAMGFTDIAVRDAINKGTTWGPRMFVSGMALTATGGHADTHFAPYTDCRNGMGIVCDSPDECRAAGRYNFKYGADQIKLMSTGGVMSTGDDVGAPEFTFEELKAICDLAKSRGRITSAHAHAGDGICLAVKAGITCIEHGSLADDEIHKLMIEYGTWLIPTLCPAFNIMEYGTAGGIPQEVVDKDKIVAEAHALHTKSAFDDGVKMGWGTDCGTPFTKHGEQAHEFELLEKIGIPAADALQMATLKNAEMLRMDDRIGSVEAGKLADIVAVDEDPIKKVSVLRRVSFVMKDGKIYKE